jgi:trehalose 6-phosphate synthase/phosphatase
MNTGFNSLDISAVAKSFKKKRNRLILLDYGGTILCNDNLDNLFRYQMVNQLRAPSLPTDRLISTLKALCADRQNTVFVVSGKERHSLVKALDKVPYLGLAAEHGMFISWPTSKPGKRIWETMVAEADRSWRPLAISIMEVYTSRTHGSYIEETEMKVLWQYRDADPEFGYLQSRELEDHLSNLLQGYAVEVLHGGMEEGGYVEVRPLGVNKGVLAMHVIKKLPKKMDFGLVLGDDHCDEPMLSVMRQIGRRVMDIQLAKRGEPPLPILPGTVTLVDVSPCDDHVTADLEMFTCTVGKKPSAAANFVNDVEDVHELLDVLIKMNLREHNSHSVPDLSTMNQNVQSSNFTTSDIRITSTIETTIAGVKRSNSLGIMMHSELPSRMSRRPSQKISGSLTEFFGAIDDIKDSEDEDEAPCF